MALPSRDAPIALQWSCQSKNACPISWLSDFGDALSRAKSAESAQNPAKDAD